VYHHYVSSSHYRHFLRQVLRRSPQYYVFVVASMIPHSFIRAFCGGRLRVLGKHFIKVQVASEYVFLLVCINYEFQFE